MHASNIALLVLAASAAAPVFSAPLSAHARTPSPDEENSLLTSREDDDMNLWGLRDVTPDELDARDDVDNLVALLSSRDFFFDHNHEVHDRSFIPDLLRYLAHAFILRDVSSDQFAAHGNVDNFIITHDFSRDHEIQARFKFTDIFKAIGRFLGFRRDVTSSNQHFSRDDVDDFISLLSTPQAKTSTRDDASDIGLLHALLQSRDVTPEQQIVARDDASNLNYWNALLQSRDFTPEQQAVARDDANNLNLLNALLQSRDVTVTPEQLLALTKIDLD